MKAASLPEHLKAWTQVKVVSVAENNLCFNLRLQLAEMNTFYRACGTHWHEYRRLYLAMIGGYHARAGIRGFVGILELKIHICLSGQLVSLCLFILFTFRCPSSRACPRRWEW